MSSKSEWWRQMWMAFTRSGPYSADWSEGRARGYREGYDDGRRVERASWEADIESAVRKLNEETGHE